MLWLPTTPIVSVDCESTSKYAEEARVIDIAAAYVTPGQPLDLRQSYVDPGMPIPPDSIKVHHITDEKIQAEGKPAADVLDLFLGEIAAAMRNGAVLLIQNARYDATVFQCEAARLGIRSLTDRLDGSIAPVIDPIVIDRRLIRFRKRVSEDQGARSLKTLAAIYGVEWDDEQAHGAAYDALTTARVAWKMASWCALPRHELMRKQTCLSATWKKVRDEDAQWFAKVAAMSPMELHEHQATWAEDQAEGLAEFWQQGLMEATHAYDAALERGDEERAAAAALDMEDLGAKLDSMTPGWPIAQVAP
jgi:DNA polymerase-3 subunit epsilon